jgi:hypothetical protein
VAKGSDHLKGFDVVKFWRGCIEVIGSPLKVNDYISARAESSSKKQPFKDSIERYQQKDMPGSPLDFYSLSEPALKNLM